MSKFDLKLECPSLRSLRGRPLPSCQAWVGGQQRPNCPAWVARCSQAAWPGCLGTARLIGLGNYVLPGHAISERSRRDLCQILRPGHLQPTRPLGLATIGLPGHAARQNMLLASAQNLVGCLSRGRWRGGRGD